MSFWDFLAYETFMHRATRDADRMEIQKYDLPTDRHTWVGARDTCVSKNAASSICERHNWCLRQLEYWDQYQKRWPTLPSCTPLTKLVFLVLFKSFWLLEIFEDYVDKIIFWIRFAPSGIVKTSRRSCFVKYEPCFIVWVKCSFLICVFWRLKTSSGICLGP